MASTLMIRIGARVIASMTTPPCHSENLFYYNTKTMKSEVSV